MFPWLTLPPHHGITRAQTSKGRSFPTTFKYYTHVCYFCISRCEVQVVFLLRNHIGTSNSILQALCLFKACAAKRKKCRLHCAFIFLPFFTCRNPHSTSFLADAPNHYRWNTTSSRQSGSLVIWCNFNPIKDSGFGCFFKQPNNVLQLTQTHP